MGGPTVGLLLSEEREPSVFMKELAELLRGFCDPVEQGATGGLHFRISDAALVGLPGHDAEQLCSFHLDIGPAPAEDDEDYSALPWVPIQEICLGGYQSGRENQRALGNLALLLAERLDALVDFYGLLDQAPSEPVVGRIYETSYQIDGDSRGHSHVGDSAFLGAWLRSPDFQMIE